MTRVLSRVGIVAVALVAAAGSTRAGSLFNPRTMIRTAELRPGMRGVAKSVFRGADITSFNVEVIGVLKKENLGGDSVLIRVLDGPVVERSTGVARGMSGSPVYIDGRLLGAIAFTYRFAKEPIGGVTPVEDMLEALEHPEKASSPPSAQASVIPAQIRGRTITQALVAGFGADEEALAEDHCTIVMEPLATPLACSGFSPRSLRLVAEALRPYGIQPVAGPGPLPEKDWVDVDLQPGSSIGVKLMDGDFTGAATGTLTYRDQNVLLAFGHPLLQAGRVDMPLATAWVHDVMPSTDISNKITSIMKTVGAVQQDRAWSIAGVLGQSAPMVNVSIQIHDRTRDLTRKYHVEVVQNEDMTVPMVLAGLFNAVDAAYKPSGRGTARVRFTIKTTDGKEIARENMFYSVASVGDATVQEAAQAMVLLTKNQFDRQKIQSVDVVSDLSDAELEAAIDDVYAEQTIAKAGEDLTLHVRLKQKDKAPVEKVVTLRVPEEVARGAMQIGICGGGNERTLEARLGISQPEPQNLGDLIERFQTTEASNRLCVIAALPNPSFRISNRELSRVPSSVAGTLAQSRWADLRQGKEKIVKVVDTEFALSGQQMLSIATEDKEGKKGRAAPPRPGAPPRPPQGAAPQPKEEEESYDAADGGLDPAAWLFGADAPGTPPGAAASPAAKPKEPPGPPKPADRKTSAEAPKPTEKPEEKAPPPVTRQAKEWLQADIKDYQKGEAKGLALVSTGQIVLAPKIETVKDSGEFYLWSAAADAQGNAYFGGGPNGIIFKLTPDGQLSTFYDSDELAIYALAFDSAGNLIAGTAPEGRILKIDPSGKGSVLHDADCQSVWALAAKGDAIYAGCGPDARVLKISADGSATEFAKLPASDVLSLAFSGDVLYAGTAGDGVVYRIEPDGTHIAVFGAEETSICALAVGPKGDVYAGTDPGGLVVRIRPNGEVETVYDEDQRAVLSLLTDGDAVYAGTGDDGKLLRITEQPDGEAAVADLGETKRPQALCLVKPKDGSLLVGTANMGTIVRAGLPPRASGHFESEVLDADVSARWGAISWVADVPEGADVYLQTRSGNAPDPDDEWSPWSRAYAKADGEPVVSPPARYLQYQVSLVGSETESPVVKSVHIVYLPDNQKPEVVLDAPKNDEALSAKYEVKWKADDPDKDKLLFGIFSSKDAGKSWDAVKEDLEEPKYEWDTAKVKDGRYALKVTASDELSNPGDALTAEKIIDPIIIDNTPPKIIEKNVGEPDANKQVTISGLAADDLTRITAVEYRVGDEGPYRGVAPADGMLDSVTERFQLTTQKLEPGENTIHVRVRDAAGNWGTEDIPIKIEGEKKEAEGEAKAEKDDKPGEGEKPKKERKGAPEAQLGEEEESEGGAVTEPE